MKLPLLLFWLFIGYQTFGQGYLPVEHIDIKEGLSFRDVRRVFQDKEGFMWFTSLDGLNRYDGVEWKIFRHTMGDSTSIPSNSTGWIYEIPNGELIVSTSVHRTSQYALYNKQDQTFKKIRFLVEDQMYVFKLEKPFLTKAGEVKALGKIFYEGQKEGPDNVQLYIFNYTGDGLFEIGQKIETSQAPLEEIGLSPERYWFFHPRHYTALDLEKGLLISNSTDGDLKEWIPCDKNGTCWTPDIHSQGEKVFDYFQLPSHIPPNDWETCNFDNHGNMWLREKNGQLFKYDVKQKSLNPEGEFKLNFVMARPFFEDKSGTLWIPSKFGVLKIRKKHAYFDTYLNGTFKFSGISNNSQSDNTLPQGIETYPIIEHNDGQILTLADWNRLYNLDIGSDTKSFEYALVGMDHDEMKYRFLATEAILFPASAGKIWLINHSAEAYLYELDSWKIIRYSMPDKFPNSSTYSGDKTLVGQQDKDGNIWYVAYSNYLYSFDTLNKTYTLYDDRIFPKGVLGIDQGIIWISTAHDLTRFDPQTNKVSTYKLPNLNIDSIQIPIYTVRPYKGKVWLGTKNGLLSFDQEEKIFKKYSSKDGLPNNTIYTIIPHKNDLWIGTHYGLCKFQIPTGEVNNYYTTDGLTHNEFNRNSAIKATDGKLYFGGMNGINAFYPDQLDSLTQLEASDLVWTGFSKIDRKTDTIKTYKSSYLNENKSIEIFDGDKSFSFRFALLNFLNPKENSYYYYLEGYENDWNYAGNAAFANYPSLPAGEYTLRVKAKDSKGILGRNELFIPILVHGPWWGTWQAITLFLAFILGSIFLYLRWRTLSLKRQKGLLEKMVEKRTEELARQRERAERFARYKEQFLANMSHEIRTPMHAISGMLKILERNYHLQDQEVFLKAMQVSSDNLLVILNDILDLSKVEAGKLEIENIPIRLSEALKHVVQVLIYKAEEKGLKLSLEIDPEVPEWIIGDPTRLSQILTNLAGNAIKFTEKGRVSLRVSRKNEFLIYEVEDTGPGIPEDKIHNIFEAFTQGDESTNRHYGGTGLGLSIARQLVELQSGNIWAESELGKGSTFLISLPLIPIETKETSTDSVSQEELGQMAIALKGVRILLAEDNLFNQMIAQDDLKHFVEDIHIDIVENGERAFEKFKSETYDLILMDVQMPETDGYEATLKIRDWEKVNQKLSIPILAMTASVLKSEVNLCFEVGMNNYIPKPYKIEELIGRIYKAL